MPGPSGENCGDCYFRHSINSRIVGQAPNLCMREPPSLIVSPGPQGQMNITGQPVPILEDGWCGQYKPLKTQ